MDKNLLIKLEKLEIILFDINWYALQYLQHLIHYKYEVMSKLEELGSKRIIHNYERLQKALVEVQEVVSLLYGDLKVLKRILEKRLENEDY